MAALVTFVVLMSLVFRVSSAGLGIKCGEVQIRITATRSFFTERRAPFKSELLRLGGTLREPCGPKQPSSHSEMVIHAGLHECGTKSRVDGDWLVYFNKLVLFPEVIPTWTGSEIVRREAFVIPVECRYKRKQTVIAEAPTPTWLPMTSTVSGYGLLHFSLRAMAEDCGFPRSSLVYQQGEAVYLEASVVAPLHPPLMIYVDRCVATLRPDPLSRPSYEFITNRGCLVDSILPGSSSKFLQRTQDNRLCFSLQAFHFNQEHGEQMFISCHLRASLDHTSPHRRDKACFFHRPTFRWRYAEGDDSPCECCHALSCFGETAVENGSYTGHINHSGAKREAERTVGPLHTTPRSHWRGRLSVND